MRSQKKPFQTQNIRNRNLNPVPVDLNFLPVLNPDICGIVAFVKI